MTPDQLNTILVVGFTNTVVGTIVGLIVSVIKNRKFKAYITIDQCKTFQSACPACRDRNANQKMLRYLVRAVRLLCQEAKIPIETQFKLEEEE